MKKKSLALLLLLALLCGLAGCGDSPLGEYLIMTEGPPLGGLRQALWMSPGDLTGLDEMMETADGSGTATGRKVDIVDTQGEDGASLQILETLGDGYRLYALFGLTLPEVMGENPSQKELDELFYLFPEIGPLEYTEVEWSIIQYDPEVRCMYFCLGITFGDPGYTDQMLTLLLKDSRGSGVARDFVHCSVRWIPHNQAPRLTAGDRGATCVISPLCLSVNLPINLADVKGVESDPNDPLNGISKTLKVVYRDGSVLDNFGGGWEADPIRVIDAKPPSGIFRLDALDHVEFLDYKFSFDGQKGGSP